MQSSIYRFNCIYPVPAITAILVVTGLMACSTSKQVTGEQITFTNASIQINGETFGDGHGLTVSGPSRGILALTMGDNGTFLISERIFEGSQPSAQASGNLLEATYYDHSIVIQSEGTIHPKGEADLWVRHDPQFHVHADSVAPAELRSYWASDYNQYRERLQDVIPEGALTNFGGEIFTRVEQEPELIGGIMQLLERVEYPVEARRNGIKGRVIIRFVIDKNGIPSNLEVIEGIGMGCDEAAMAAISEARFTPGRSGGQPVRVQFSLPIYFRI